MSEGSLCHQAQELEQRPADLIEIPQAQCMRTVGVISLLQEACADSFCLRKEGKTAQKPGVCKHNDVCYEPDYGHSLLHVAKGHLKASCQGPHAARMSLKRHYCSLA